MKLNHLNNNHIKNKKEFISVGLLGVSAAMVVLIAVKVTAFIAAPARAEDSVKKAVALSKMDSEEVEKHLAKSKEIADQLKKDNLFAPPPPKQHPVNKDQVLGILGDEVLINGRWYKTGDNVGDAKIIAIEPAQVRIEWDGKEQTFLPIDAKVASSSDQRRPGGQRPPQEARPGGQGQSEAVQVQVEVRGAEGMGGFGGEDFRDRMMRMRERFENMSPEEREQARAEFRERFGNRGPRGEGGPGGRRGGRGRRE